MKRPEQALQQAVARFLDLALPKDAFWTAIPLGGGGRLRGAIMKGMGAKAGTPDILILYKGDIIFIELKSARGVVSDIQQDTMAQIRAAGGATFVCRTVDEVESDLHYLGIPLRTKRDWIPRTIKQRVAG